MRIKRDTVPTNAGAGIEGHEAEGLGGGGANHFPSVYAERVAEARHLVGHTDIHRAKSVL